MKRRIFIAGHGMMSQEQAIELNLPVHFYVDPGEMLDNVFIPGIIQLASGNANFDYHRLTQVLPNIDGHNYCLNTRNEHIIFALKDDNPALCRPYNYDNKIEVWNRVNITHYSIVGESRPFLNPPQNIQIANININLHSGNNELKFSNDILIYPTQIIGEQTAETINNFLKLSDIIQWSERKYINDDLEFYWLACRQYLK